MRRAARSDTRADRDRERYLAGWTALTGQTVAPGQRAFHPLPPKLAHEQGRHRLIERAFP